MYGGREDKRDPMSDEDFCAPDDAEEVVQISAPRKRKAPEDKKEAKKKRKTTPRGRNWAWTWNTRWDEDEDEGEVMLLSAYLQQRMTNMRDREEKKRGGGRYLVYVVWQVERALNGRWHFQGYMYISKSVRMKWIKDTLGEEGLHCELANNPENARNYCMKEHQVMDLTKHKKKNPGVPAVLWWGHKLHEGEKYAKRVPGTQPVEVGQWTEERDAKGFVKPLGHFKDAIIEEGNAPSSDINLIHRFPDAMAKYVPDSVFDDEFPIVQEYCEENWDICKDCMNPNMFCHCLFDRSDYNCDSMFLI